MNLPATGVDLSDSGLHALLAFRVQPLAQFKVLYVGTGLSVSEVILRLRSIPPDEQSTGVARALFTGMSVRIGPLNPFVEAHLLDVFAFSDLEGQLYPVLGAQL